MSILSRLVGGWAGSAKAVDNPALNYIRSIEQTPVTETFISALPNLSLALITEAKQAAKTVGVPSALFAECVLDLELFGGFNQAMSFGKDKALVSAYMDAIVIEATGKNPSLLPTDDEFKFGGTQNYRGLGKYAVADRHFNVESPHSWLFGKEFSALKTGSALDLAYTAGAALIVPGILDTGDALFALISELAKLDFRGKSTLTLADVLRSIDPERAKEIYSRWLKDS